MKAIWGGDHCRVDLVIHGGPEVVNQRDRESFGETGCVAIETTENSQLSIRARGNPFGVYATDQSGTNHSDSNWLCHSHPLPRTNIQSTPWDSSRQLLTLIEVKAASS